MTSLLVPRDEPGQGAAGEAHGETSAEKFWPTALNKAFTSFLNSPKLNEIDRVPTETTISPLGTSPSRSKSSKIALSWRLIRFRRTAPPTRLGIANATKVTSSPVSPGRYVTASEPLRIRWPSERNRSKVRRWEIRSIRLRASRGPWHDGCAALNGQPWWTSEHGIRDFLPAYGRSAEMYASLVHPPEVEPMSTAQLPGCGCDLSGDPPRARAIRTTLCARGAREQSRHQFGATTSTIYAGRVQIVGPFCNRSKAVLRSDALSLSGFHLPLWQYQSPCTPLVGVFYSFPQMWIGCGFS